MHASESVYTRLLEAGVDALLDDRTLSAGARLTDLELLGFPYVVLVGRSWKKDGKAEIRCRRSGAVEFVKPHDIVQWLVDRLETTKPKP